MALRSLNERLEVCAATVTIVINPASLLHLHVLLLLLLGPLAEVHIFVEVGHDGKDPHVNGHEDGKHEELGGLVQRLRLGHDDHDQVAKSNSQEPSSLEHGLHGVRGLERERKHQVM